MKISRVKWYILPLCLFLLFVQYHYFDFYQSDFAQMNALISPSSSLTQYEQIQNQHPYADIYHLAQQFKNDEKTGVYFVFTRKTKETLDYTSTVLASQEKKKHYLSEYGVMIRYFFYPRTVPFISFQKLKTLPLQKGDIIFSDLLLGKNYLHVANLAPIPLTAKTYVHIQKWPPRDVYIYQVSENIL